MMEMELHERRSKLILVQPRPFDIANVIEVNVKCGLNGVRIDERQIDEGDVLQVDLVSESIGFERVILESNHGDVREVQ